MPKIISTITRAQSDAIAIPRLPKAIDEMNEIELYDHLHGVRINRMLATDKRKTTRATNKRKKADKAATNDDTIVAGGVDVDAERPDDADVVSGKDGNDTNTVEE